MKTSIFSLVLILSSCFCLFSQPTQEIQKLLAADGASDDQLGSAVCISGNIAIVGAPNENGATGAAYIYLNNNGVWSQQQKLTASDATTDDNFGCAVSVNGDLAIVGAYLEDGTGINRGAAYIFKNILGVWQEYTKLMAYDAEDQDYFGGAVSITDEYAIVGAIGEDAGGTSAGAVYVYNLSSGIWIGDIKLMAADAGANMYFGKSVGISGDYIIVGAHFDDAWGDGTGAAYLFKRNAAIWIEHQKLVASNVQPLDYFGVSVDIFGDFAIVGAWGVDGAGSDRGAAYIFINNAETWSEHLILTAPDGEDGDEFGKSVSISGDFAIVGSHLEDDGGTEAGAAYIYRGYAVAWAYVDKIGALDADADDEFGSSVCVSGDYAIVGAPYNDDSGLESGSAYVFGPNFPSITNQPQNHVNLCGGTNITFSVSGEYITDYQWLLSTDGGNNFDIIQEVAPYSGTQTSTLAVVVNADMDDYLYQCMVSNIAGDETSNTAILTIESELPTIICPNSISVTADQSNSYTVQGTTFDPLSTSDNCDVASVENDYNQLSTLSGEVINGGINIITWTVTDVSGNQEVCNFNLTVEEYVGIDNIDQKQISFYPNPTTGIITVDVEDIQFIEILDVEERRIFYSEENNQIDLSEYSKGIYFIKVTTGTGEIIEKIILE